MKIHNMEQKSEEWFAIRKGKMTASHAQAIATNGKGLDTYILEMMSEYYSSGEKEYYSNKDTERGNELEPIAREWYEMKTDNKVEEVGFIEFDEYAGCSPDGLIGDDGLVEIKCPNDNNYFKVLLNGEKAIESKYVWQVQMQMLLMGRKWCDLVYYNPNFKESIKIFRIELDDAKTTKLSEGLRAGREKIIAIKSKIDEN